MNPGQRIHGMLSEAAFKIDEIRESLTAVEDSFGDEERAYFRDSLELIERAALELAELTADQPQFSH